MWIVITNDKEVEEPIIIYTPGECGTCNCGLYMYIAVTLDYEPPQYISITFV